MYMMIRVHDQAFPEIYARGILKTPCSRTSQGVCRSARLDRTDIINREYFIIFLDNLAYVKI